MNRLVWTVLLACVIAVSGPRPSGQEHGGPVLEPAVLADDFSGDSLSQWASYPPAQDLGYEPSLAPTTEFDAPGGRALMRVVQPVVEGQLDIGFIKELSLVTAPDARLDFSYRVEPSVLRATVHVGLAGSDGKRYTAKFPATSGAWTKASVQLRQFHDAQGVAPPDGLRFEAAYIVAGIEHATPDITCRFLIDDVRLRAAREAQFTLREPASRPLSPWREQPSSRVYRAGSTIPIEAGAPTPLARAAWTLTGPSGQRIAEGTLRREAAGERKGGSVAWTGSAAYQVGPEDPSGVWRLTLDGSTPDGRRMETTVRLLVGAPRGGTHPRLYFSPEDAERIRARRTHPRLTELWATLRKAAVASRETGPIAEGDKIFAELDPVYLLPSLPAYFDVMNRARARVANNAIVGYVDGDRVAKETARTALLEVARWSAWAPPWFEAHGQHTYYPAGQLATAVALAYDLLYHDLAPDERQLVRRALLERSILPTWREYVLDNRIMADTSNWIAHTVGGAIIAAAAVFGDGTPEEDEALALPLNGLLMKIEDHMAASYLPDGSYGEGISYLEFDLETLGPMLWATERVFGQSYWERTHVLDGLRHPMHTLADPIAEGFDMGDTHPPAGHAIAPIVARSKDSVIRWYGSLFAPRGIHDFLLFDDSIPPKAPDGFGSRVFDSKGDAVLRTGWDAEAGLVLFRAGPTFNHNHSDQGSFQFRALGETLITEAGWSDYYKDPYYQTYFTQAAGHNTLLVDGNPASQSIADTAQFAALNRYPRITDAILSETFDAVSSELAPVYRDRLDGYTRRLVYLKPDRLIVFDRVRVSGKPARLTWRLHVPRQNGLTQPHESGATAVYEGTRASLGIRAAASAEIQARVGDGRIPYHVFATRAPAEVPPRPGILDLDMPGPVEEAWILMALAPARTTQAARDAAAALEPIAAPGWAALSTRSAETREIIAFSAGEGSRRAPLDGWVTDADVWTVKLAGRRIQRLGAQQLRELGDGDTIWVRADQPIGISLEYAANRLTGVFTANVNARVRLRVDGRPSRVAVNGRPAAITYDPASHLLELIVPAGSSALDVAFGGA